MNYTVTFRYTFTDYRRLYRAVKARTRLGTLPLPVRFLLEGTTFVSIAFLVACTMEGGWIDPTQPDVVMALAGTLIAFAVVRLLWDVAIVPLSLRLAFRRFAAANAEMTLTIDEERLRWSLEHGLAGEAHWQAVKRIDLINGDLFLFFSPAEAFPVPRRALQTDAEFANLERFIRLRVPHTETKR